MPIVKPPMPNQGGTKKYKINRKTKKYKNKINKKTRKYKF